MSYLATRLNRQAMHGVDSVLLCFVKLMICGTSNWVPMLVWLHNIVTSFYGLGCCTNYNSIGNMGDSY